MLKREPQPLQEFRPPNFEADYQKRYDEQASSSDDDSESDSDNGDSKRRRQAAAVDSDDEWSQVGEDRQTRRTN